LTKEEAEKLKAEKKPDYHKEHIVDLNLRMGIALNDLGEQYRLPKLRLSSTHCTKIILNLSKLILSNLLNI